MDFTGRDVNLAVARMFEEIAQSLEVAGEQVHRRRAYRRAARSVAATPESLEDLAVHGRLRDIAGSGPSLSALIAEFLETGSLDYPDDTLAALDYVSASVHRRFKQSGAAMTARILRAIQHPLVHARMDLDGTWARRVRAAGGRVTISSDAHSTVDFDNIWLAIGSARRGWLGPDDVLNTRPLADFRAVLRSRR